MQTIRTPRLSVVACLVAITWACSGGESGDATSTTPSPSSTVIRLTGSDTMVNLDQAWAENYKKVQAGRLGAGRRRRVGRGHRRADRRHPGHRRLQPQDGADGDRAGHAKHAGSAATGVRGRPRRPGRLRPRQDNPIEEISIDELAEIYGDGGKIDEVVAAGRSRTRRAPATRSCASAARTTPAPTPTSARPCWADAGVQAGLDRPERLEGRGRRWCRARRARSATAAWPTATPGVETLKVSKKKGEPAVAPTLETAPTAPTRSRGRCTSTPTATPTPPVKEFIDWTLSDGRPEDRCRTSATCRLPRSTGTVSRPRSQAHAATRQLGCLDHRAAHRVGDPAVRLERHLVRLRHLLLRLPRGRAVSLRGSSTSGSSSPASTGGPIRAIRAAVRRRWRSSPARPRSRCWRCVLAVPAGLGAAVFVSEFCQPRLRESR